MPNIKHNLSKVQFDVQGEGRALLFMHGFGADRLQAMQMIEGLSGYRIITIDMPGHGKSYLSACSALKDQVGFRRYADVAQLVLTYLSVRSAVVGGVSMGAGIALNLALRKPRLVEALLLVRPAWLNSAGPPNLSIIEDIGNWIAKFGVAEASLRLVKHPKFKSLLRKNPACAASIEGAINRSQGRSAAGVLSALVADRPFARFSALHNCTMPALVVGNNADPLHPARIARKISGALPKGHYFHALSKYLEPAAHSNAVNNTIDQFLNKC